MVRDADCERRGLKRGYHHGRGRDGRPQVGPGDAKSADLRGIDFIEPEMAVGPGDDTVRTAVSGGERELDGDSGRSDAADLVGAEVREPEVAVGAEGDLSLGEAPGPGA